jgi:hypothetical protein
MTTDLVLCQVRYAISGELCGEPAVHAYENMIHQKGSRHRYYFCCEIHRKEKCSQFDWEVPLAEAIVKQVMDA